MNGDQAWFDEEFAAIAEFTTEEPTDPSVLFSWEDGQVRVHGDISPVLTAAAVVVVEMLGTNIGGLPDTIAQGEPPAQREAVAMSLAVDAGDVLATAEQTLWSPETAVGWMTVLNHARLELMRRAGRDNLAGIDPEDPLQYLAAVMTQVLDCLCREMY